MEGGDLQSKIPAVNKATGQRAFGWAGRGRRVALDIARGLHYLHRWGGLRGGSDVSVQEGACSGVLWSHLLPGAGLGSC